MAKSIILIKGRDEQGRFMNEKIEIYIYPPFLKWLIQWFAKRKIKTINLITIEL